MATSYSKTTVKSSKPESPTDGHKDRMPVPQGDRTHEQGSFKDQHVPLRDPSEGKSPAVIGRDLTRDGEVEQGEPDPPVWTVGDEQRERSAYIESVGVEAYKDEIDERSDEERQAHPTVAPEPQRYGSDEPHEEGRRQIEHSERRP